MTTEGRMIRQKCKTCNGEGRVGWGTVWVGGTDASEGLSPAYATTELVPYSVHVEQHSSHYADEKCTQCNGERWVDLHSAPRICPTCEGSGQRKVLKAGNPDPPKPCLSCKGAGSVEIPWEQSDLGREAQMRQWRQEREREDERRKQEERRKEEAQAEAARRERQFVKIGYWTVGLLLAAVLLYLLLRNFGVF